MGKIITIQVIETFEVPDEWEIIKDDENREIIKIDTKNFLDFSIIPYKAHSMKNGPTWTMLNTEDYTDIIDEGLNLLKADCRIEYITNKEELKKLQKMCL